ncbi:MAG: spore maturation protein [Erysipelotrichaceae bacterium]|nr:spore maturation protein [Erysipelotrichaceae bacterium]MBQ9986987.1 spore maturation protein [Erysipelotrichales bacterium]MBR3693039.1 spore maturation protein [Erysipelotrichales bacterium]
MNGMTVYIMSTLILILIYLSLRKKIPAYDIFVSGCKEGILLFYQVFPALLAMMFCIRLLELSPFIEWLYALCSYLQLPISPSVLPMFLFRPISGSASLALYIDILSKEGGDSLSAILGGAIQGATDTTFYVIALYYGSIQVRKIGHTLWLSLLADVLAMGLVVYFIYNFA